MLRLKISALALGFASLIPALVLTASGPTVGEALPSKKAAVGKLLFTDTNLSNPPGQSCASCHDAGTSFTDPRGTFTSEGAVAGRFGSRQSPSAGYAAFSPAFHFDSDKQNFVGGQFWDGRASGLSDQARLPFLNPIEMNNASPAEVVAKVATGPAAAGLKAVYGNDIFDSTETAYSAIVDAIAEFEKISKFSPFTSRYDAYLKGQVSLTEAEDRGLNLFNGKAKCASCHPSQPGPNGEPPLFTDFSYHNIGAPKNKNNPFYTQPPQFNPAGGAFIDLGLFNTTGRQVDKGRFKVPTLRNIARTAPYFHNGSTPTLEGVVILYNTRDLPGFPTPEVTQNVDHDLTGNLELSAAEATDLVTFLKTLTDGYQPTRRP